MLTIIYVVEKCHLYLFERYLKIKIDNFNFKYF